MQIPRLIGLFLVMLLPSIIYCQKTHPSGFGTHEDTSARVERIVREADRLRKDWKAGALELAINKYEQAIGYYTTLGDEHRRAEVLARIGDVSSILSRYETAIDYYEEALRLGGNATDPRSKVNLLNQIADAYLEMARPKEAASYCRQAQEISSKIAYQRGAGQALNSLGLINSMSGNVYEAQQNFNQALMIWEHEDYQPGRTYTLLNLGYLNGNIGNAQTSLSFYERARAVAQTIDDHQLLALILTAIGGHYALDGEKQKAMEFHNDALNLFRTMGNRGGEAVTLNGIGYLYDDLGKTKAALTRYTRALELFQAIHNQRYAAITLGYIGRVYFALDKKEKALEAYNQKLITSRAVEDPRMEAYTLKDIGNVLVSLDHKEQAEDCYKKALELSRVVADRRGEAYVHASLGSLHERVGERLVALEDYRTALRLMRAVTDRRGEISTLYSVARIERDLGHLTEARNDIETSLRIIEKLRGKVASPSLRYSFVETVYQHYEFYLDLLMRLGQKDPNAGYETLALEVSEHARARTLLENLRVSRIDIRQGVASELLVQEHQVQQLLNQKAEQQMRLLSGKYVPEQAIVLKTEIESLVTQFEDIESKVRDKSPQYAALTQPLQRSLPELQRELDDDTLLIEYALGAEQSYAWVVTNGSIAAYVLAGRSQIEAASKVLYEILDSSDSKRQLSQTTEAYTQAAAHLSSMLLDPMRTHLRRRRLVIVADGILQYIPFGVLTDPEPNSDQSRQPLIVSHEIITLPSLSTLAILRSELLGRPKAPKAVVVLADPVFEKTDPRIAFARKTSSPPNRSERNELDLQDQRLLRAARDLGRDDGPVTFGRLPFSVQEAQSIFAVAPTTDTMRALGFDASLRTALDPELRKYRIVHFATHGLLNNYYPELSGVVLSLFNRQGQRQDGFLRLNEIYNLNLSADLVVLSACQTGIGKQVRGEGLIGLTRGFMYAGVPRVVAGLWRIDDRAAAELMRYFYEAMFVSHLTPAAALRAAQIKMWQRGEWRLPHYWAAFVLQGEWN